jgi:hypothetical protein
MTNTWSTYRIVCLSTVLISVLIGILTTHYQYVINPDGVYYLWSAEFIQQGKWNAALSIFPWPLYSILIAALSNLSTLDAISTALVINIVFSAASAWVFIAIVRQLFGDQQKIILFAAILITLHVGLNDWRPVIIRDHGYILFSLVAIYAGIHQSKAPSFFTVFITGIAALLATLFRIEGIAIVILALAYPIIVNRCRRPYTLQALLLILIASIIGFTAIVALDMNTNLAAIHSHITNSTIIYSNNIELITRKLTDIFPKFEKNNASTAYYVISLLFFVSGSLLIIRFHVFILFIYYMYINKIHKNTKVNFFILYYSSGLSVVLIAFACLNFFFVERYAFLLSIIMTIPAAAAMAHIHDGWQSKKTPWIPKRPWTLQRYIFPIFFTIFLIDFNDQIIPRKSNIIHITEAAKWLSKNVPKKSNIASNDPRILYYAGSKIIDGDDIVRRVTDANADPDIYWGAYDFIALVVTKEPKRARQFYDAGMTPVATIEGVKNDLVLIFDQRH